MKKLLLGLALTSVLGVSVCCGNIKPQNVYAEGEEPTTSEIESETPITSETETSEENTDTEIVIPTPDEVKDWGEKLLEKWLSPETIVLITTWASALTSLIILVVRYMKTKRLQVMTAREVKDEVVTNLDGTVRNVVQEIEPVILNALNTQTKVLETFAKVLALSQENTPESRVAIINLLSEIGILKEETAEETKKIIDAQVKENQEKNEKVDEELDKIIDDGTSV